MRVSINEHRDSTFDEQWIEMLIVKHTRDLN
jgi:hypothetical protein